MKHVIDGFWVKDPSTNKPSISLSLMLVAFVAALGASALQAAGQIQSTASFTEILYSFVALYFGRRMNIGGKSFSGNEENK